MSIRAKLILILACSLSAAALGVSLATHLFAAKEADAVFARNAAMHMDRVEDIVQAYFAAGSQAAKTLAALPEASDEKLLRDNDGADSAAKSALLRRFALFHAVVPGVEAVFCGYKNGLFLALPEKGGTSRENAPGETIGDDFRKRAWFSDAAFGTARVSATDAYISDTTKSLAAIFSAAIQNTSGEIAGVAGVSVSLASLVDALRDIRIGTGGYIVIFDGKGRIILDPEAQENLLRTAEDSGDTALGTMARLPAGAHTLMRNGTVYAAYARPLAPTRWKAVLLADANALSGTANSLTFNTALAALAVMAAAFVLGSLAVIRATSPLYALIRQSSALADGNTEALEVIPGRGPDISVLHGNLGRLTGRIMLLLQTEKDRRDENIHVSTLTIETRQETARLKEALRNAHREERKKMVAAFRPIATELAAAVNALSIKATHAMTQAKTQLVTADEVRATATGLAADAALFARQATETETNADGSLALAAEFGAKYEETAHGIEGARNTAFSLAGNLEGLKADITELAELASSVRDIAEQANLLGFNVSLDAKHSTGGEKELKAIVEKIRAIAENAMTVAGTADAVTASFEQQYAVQMQALNKTLAALKRAAFGNAKAKSASSDALTGLAATTEQFRVLATALEGLAQMGSDNAEHTDALMHASLNVADLLREIDAAVASLTVLSARLAATAEELEDEKVLD